MGRTFSAAYILLVLLLAVCKQLSPLATTRGPERTEEWIPAFAGMTCGAGMTQGQCPNAEPDCPAGSSQSRELPERPGKSRKGRLAAAKMARGDCTDPGGEEPAPADIDEVLIGYFGPADPCHVQGGGMWCAASLAIEQANLSGGYKGLPFRLVHGWSDNPWGSGVKQVVRMAYVDKVWAVIGGIDGSSTHLAEQVVAKARLTLISPGSTDRTANLANVPWMFSCLPGDNLQTCVLAQAIEAHVQRKPFLLVSAVDHDSHIFAVELTKSLARKQMVPAYHFEFRPDEKNLAGLVQKVINTQTDAVVLIAGSQQSARLTSAMRESGFQGLIFGGPTMGQRDFTKKAGNAAEGAIFPLLYAPGGTSEDFERTFTARFGNRPDYLAAHTYDAVNLLVAAIRKAGLNRTRIRDAVKELSGWQGVAGPILWDSRGSNSRPIVLGTVTSGQLKQLSQIERDPEAFISSGFLNCLQ